MADRLLYFPGSPFARMCRILVLEWDLDIELVELSFPPEPWLFEKNPLGQVPVLVRGDGNSLFPTLIILEELWARAGSRSESYDSRDRQRLLTTLQAGDAFVAARYQDWTGLGPVRENIIGYDLAERNLERFSSVLDWLELSEPAPGITLQNVALVCILLWSDARGGPNWRHRKKLASLVDSLAARESFLKTQPPAF